MIVTTRGSIAVNAEREAVWAALHDADRVALCVPGCRDVVRDSATSYSVTASVRFGPVRVAVDGTVAISDFEEPSRLVLSGRGRGGLAGTARGTAAITLTERPAGCRLSYEVEAETDGPVAQLGSMFLTGLAATLADLFVRRFAQLFDEPAAVPQKRLRLGRLSVF